MLGSAPSEEPQPRPLPPSAVVNIVADAHHFGRRVMSSRQRSRHHLKTLGYRAAVVEKWNPFAKIQQDLFAATCSLWNRTSWMDGSNADL